MTRFQIVGIFEDKILTAGEFNGDGYFDGMGKEVCREFATITTEKEYKKLANDINENDYQYPGQIIFEVKPTAKAEKDGSEIDVFDFDAINRKNEYYKLWFSDYLYIKNFSEEDKEIIDENGIKIIVHPQGWVTLYFGNLYTHDDGTIEEKSQYNVDIEIQDTVKYICEKHGWTITDDENGYLEIGQYTPAGEDFSFSVSKENAIEEIKEYAENFDVDEHVKLWIGGRGAPGIRGLLEDAEWIDNELQELAEEF